MWSPGGVTWPASVRSAAQRGELVVVVGNGLSRFSGAPSWEGLFDLPGPARWLRQCGVVRSEGRFSGSLLEVADVVFENRAAWSEILGEINDWNRRLKPNLAHRILADAIRPRAVATTNFDNLLAKAGLQAVYVHGVPDDPASWVLTTSSYRAQLARSTNALKNVAGGNSTVLFVGYGHAESDYDIASVFNDWQDHGLNLGRAFSLTSDTDVLLESRLRKLGISQLGYGLPSNPTSNDRLAALAHALCELCDQSGIEVPAEARAELDALVSEIEDRNSRTSLVVGLATRNLVSRPVRFPTRTRESIRAEVHEESGGPGYVVSRVLAALGHPVALVTRLASDEAGRFVHRDVSSHRFGLIDTDYVDRAPAWSGERTWQSYVLIDDEQLSNRVVLDESRTFEELAISADRTRQVAEAIHAYSPRFIYVDKYFRSVVNEILRSPLGRPLPRNSVVVYESGSDGEWWSDHELERTVIAGQVNIPVVSFRFARDFLARKLGDLGDREWQRLGGGEIGHRQTFSAENATIDELIGSAELGKALAEAILIGADKWLRRQGPRAVVMTLHGYGCMWFSVDHDRWLRVDAPAVVGATASSLFAGDVFRGAYIGGSIELEKAGRDAFDPDGLSAVCELASAAASLKVASLTLEGSLGPIAAFAHDWRSSHGL